MKMDLKVTMTIAIIGVFVVLLGTYLYEEYNGGQDHPPQIKDDVVVGDYITLHNYQSYAITETESMDVDLFYDYYFKADIENMTYVSDVSFILGGMIIACESYNSDEFTVYVTKESKMQVYSEYDDGDAILFLELTACSLDIVEGFTADDIQAGMSFAMVSNSANSAVTETEYTVNSIDGELLEYTAEMEVTYLIDRTITVEEVDGDTLVLDNGSEVTKEAFVQILSKEYVFDELLSGFEITDKKTYDYEYYAEFGTFMSKVDRVYGNNGYTELDGYFYYVGKDTFLKAMLMLESASAITFYEFEIVNTSMFV